MAKTRATFRLVSFWAFALWAAVVPAAAQEVQDIYTNPAQYNDLRNHWTIPGYVTINTNDTTPGFDHTQNSNLGRDQASISVSGAKAAGYGGIEFRHDIFDSGLYKSLTFWVNGGAAGGQVLQVLGTLDGVPQQPDRPFVVSQPLQPNTWTPVTVLLTGLGVDYKLNFTGFLVQVRPESRHDASGIVPTFYLDDIRLMPGPAPGVVQVAVDAGKAVRTVDDRFFGINLLTTDKTLDSGASVMQLSPAVLDCRTLRFPGGNLSNSYNWWDSMVLHDQPGTALGTEAYAGVSVARFAAVAEALHQKVILTVNYGSGTPEEAAALVAYCNGAPADSAVIGTDERGRDWHTVGYWAQLRGESPKDQDDGQNILRATHPAPWHFQYFEVGNEGWGDWQFDEHGNAKVAQQFRLSGSEHDPATYASEAAKFLQLMRAVDPSIKVGVVATYDHQYPSPTDLLGRAWNEIVLSKLKDLGAYPDAVIQHWYPQIPDEATDQGLFLTNSNRADSLIDWTKVDWSENSPVWSDGALTWSKNAKHLRHQLEDAFGPRGDQIEMICDENNSSYYSTLQMTSLTNGLYLAGSLGSALYTDYNGLLWWDFHDGQIPAASLDPAKTPEPEPDWWRPYADFGLLNLTADGSTTYYPTFYVTKLLSHFARGGDTVVQATTDTDLFSAYAVKRADGTLSILGINKAASVPLSANIQINGFTPSTDVSVYSYGAAQDRSLADVAQSGFAGAAATFTYSFPAYSVTLLSINPEPTVASVTVTPQSVAGGTAAQGTVTLTGPAPTSGVTVALSSSLAAVTMPATVQVAAGSTSATFQVQTPYALTATSAIITAALSGSTPSATLTITPTPGTSFSAGLKFFSVPFDYPGMGLDGVFGYSGVKLAAWNPASFQYMLTPNAPADQLRLGYGYWARFPKDVTLEQVGVPADPKAAFPVPLLSGWNAVGDPFPAPLALKSLTFVGAGGPLSFDQASGPGGIIKASVYAYDPSLNSGGGYSALGADGRLQPGQGYWIYALQQATMSVPPP